jgi:hypothetical protein
MKRRCWLPLLLIWISFVFTRADSSNTSSIEGFLANMTVDDGSISGNVTLVDSIVEVMILNATLHESGNMTSTAVNVTDSISSSGSGSGSGSLFGSDVNKGEGQGEGYPTNASMSWQEGNYTDLLDYGDDEGVTENEQEGEGGEENEKYSQPSTSPSLNVTEGIEINITFWPSSVPSAEPTKVIGEAIIPAPTLRPTAAQLYKPATDDGLSNPQSGRGPPNREGQNQVVYTIFAFMLFLFVPTFIGLSMVFNCFSKTYVASVDACYPIEVDSNQQDPSFSYYSTGDRRSIPKLQGLFPAMNRGNKRFTSSTTASSITASSTRGSSKGESKTKLGISGNPLTTLKDAYLFPYRSKVSSTVIVGGDEDRVGDSMSRDEQVTTILFASPHDWSAECSRRNSLTTTVDPYAHNPYMTESDEASPECFSIEDVDDDVGDFVESVSGMHNSKLYDQQRSRSNQVKGVEKSKPAITKAMLRSLASLYGMILVDKKSGGGAHNSDEAEEDEENVGEETPRGRRSLGLLTPRTHCRVASSDFSRVG